MEIMLKKFCKKYKLPEKSLFELLSHMEEISFSKGELIIEKGERNSNFYLIKKGIGGHTTWQTEQKNPYGLPLPAMPHFLHGGMWTTNLLRSISSL